MARGSSPIDVLDYLDYRALLRDYYVAKKDEKVGFSYRAFSQRAGLRSPNHLMRVVDGERGLTPAMAIRYAKAMGLDTDATSYFCDLVAFNQATSAAERDATYQRLTGARGYRKAHKLDAAQAQYHSTWYLPAIREMVVRPDFQDDPAWIAKRMIPPVTTAQASKALSLLLDIGLLVRASDGHLAQGDPVVTTGPETRSLHVARYHRAMSERAMESIDLVPREERDISSLTFCVGADGLRRLKLRIQRFRKELMAMATLEQDGEQVVQLNMQLFPLTTRRGKETP